MITPTGIEAEVCKDIAERQAHGLAKYGTTVADNPLSLKQWLQHAYEETLDKAVYLKRAMAEIDVIVSDKTQLENNPEAPTYEYLLNYYNRTVEPGFIRKMDKELKANQHKGDWRKWKPSAIEGIKELNYHFAKLVYALAKCNRKSVSEHAADVACVCMKIDEVLGTKENAIPK